MSFFKNERAVPLKDKNFILSPIEEDDYETFQLEKNNGTIIKLPDFEKFEELIVLSKNKEIEDSL